MRLDLPDDDTLYKALLARDPVWDGRAFVGVTSTGILCRLTCPARKPKRENCVFFGTIGGGIEAGFRPCKRCHPMQPAAQSDPTVQTLIKALEVDPSRRWREGDLVAMGHDPSTVRRAFKRHFGMTFLEMARQTRLHTGLTTLAQDGRVIDAQLDAGFSSGAAFRAAFARHLGLPPGAFRSDALLRADWFQTPLGPMIAVSDATHLHLLEFTDRKALPTELKRLHKACKGSLGFGRLAPTDQIEAQLDDYFQGRSARFNVPLALHGTPFTCAVWDMLQTLPAGSIHSYSDIARRMDRPESTRAVARANGANQIAIVIPCHRVMGADGALTGYGGGLWRKQKLIDLERQYAPTESIPA
ncbi:bifunctional transcriptional activator/DNA repair enzyme AdaA [Falsiruegeria mediterranea]|uniref:methylated-DNA--[protein]-cysteine S-methyltransferase n=1 Tax=Falsiruegeria mediterranea M17 TaxID=1200281 RepID=A0A2R8C2E6_9RHOB|nr:trifunctional transcriptional activator/DNA repair protein Ada/methylated-DNA--[protein]-cysteine S-methyltransferase [Falsiruegeria mediterranea]SPJ26604.1 Bifunctional transcriptional activator/DNA repair enzyme Ada [Falsiruegeria mediterranea M17]